MNLFALSQLPPFPELFFVCDHRGVSGTGTGAVDGDGEEGKGIVAGSTTSMALLGAADGTTGMVVGVSESDSNGGSGIDSGSTRSTRLLGDDCRIPKAGIGRGGGWKGHEGSRIDAGSTPNDWYTSATEPLKALDPSIWT